MPVVHDPATGGSQLLLMASSRKSDAGARSCRYPMLKPRNTARGGPLDLRAHRNAAVTGRPVPTRELEGHVWCWESPGHGWLFAPTPSARSLGPVPSVEDASVTKTVGRDGIGTITSGDQAVVSTTLPGVPYEVSAKAQLFLAKRLEGQGRILIVTPAFLNGMVAKGCLVEREGVYYLPNEV
jgi:hypothetical protein